MSEQVFSAYRAIQLNNRHRNVCCNIGNTMRYVDVTNGKKYCRIHVLTVSKDKRGVTIPVRGVTKRYA